MPEYSLEEPGSASQTARSGSGGILALVLLFIINLVNQIDRRGLVVIFPLLQLEWGLTDTQLGLAVSLFTITRALAALPAGWLADKVGALRILRPLALIWSLLAALSGWAGSFFGFIGIRTAVGLADGANGPLDLAYLGRVSPPKRRGLYFSIYSVAVYAGSALGVVFAGVVADRFGWRPVFYIPAGVGLLAALGLFFLPARTEEKAEQEAISEVRREDSAIRSLLHKPLLAIYIGGACGVFASTGLVSWLPSYLMRQFELGLKQAGFLNRGINSTGQYIGSCSGRLVK